MDMIKERVNISDVLFFQEGPGVRNTQYTTSGVKLLNVANLVDGNIDLSTSDRYISEDEAYGKYSHFLCDDGDFIVASSGIKVEYIDKKMGFVDNSMLPLCMNTSTIRFKVLDSEKLNIRYFMYYLKSQDFKNQLAMHITGSAQLNYGPSHLKKMTMPIVGINKQEKIVEILDKVNKVIETRKQQLEQLDDLVKARFVEMFGDAITNPYEWEKVTVGDVCSSIVRGPFGSALKKEFFVEPNETTYKVYEQKHAIQKSATIGTYYVTAEKYNELKRFECVAGDILMSCSGTMGELYQLPIGCEKGLINQALCKFTLNDKILPIVFLTYMKQTIGNLETKGSGIQNIAAVSYVKAMPINLPPLDVQKQFATFVEQVDKSKVAVQKALDEAQTLFNSLMQEYFG